jgi:hypothetical protein
VEEWQLIQAHYCLIFATKESSSSSSSAAPTTPGSSAAARASMWDSFGLEKRTPLIFSGESLGYSSTQHKLQNFSGESLGYSSTQTTQITKPLLLSGAGYCGFEKEDTTAFIG